MGTNKKTIFVERLKKVNEKYAWNTINIEQIKRNLYQNNVNELLENCKRIRHILLAKIKIENRTFTMDQIEVSVKYRIEQMENDKKKMLNSILEREVRSININCLLVNKQGETELILDEEEVKKETNNHFKGITDTSLKENKNLEKYWEEEYAPRQDIETEIYKDLLNDINVEEWLAVIKELPLNKAGGPSKITYDIIKELSGEMKEIMRKFFNEVINTQLLPT